MGIVSSTSLQYSSFNSVKKCSRVNRCITIRRDCVSHCGGGYPSYSSVTNPDRHRSPSMMNIFNQAVWVQCFFVRLHIYTQPKGGNNVKDESSEKITFFHFLVTYSVSFYSSLSTLFLLLWNVVVF